MDHAAHFILQPSQQQANQASTRTRIPGSRTEAEKVKKRLVCPDLTGRLVLDGAGSQVLPLGTRAARAPRHLGKARGATAEGSVRRRPLSVQGLHVACRSHTQPQNALDKGFAGPSAASLPAQRPLLGKVCSWEQRRSFHWVGKSMLARRVTVT